jgi:GNAT superfamily N-acetyltransferase
MEQVIKATRKDKRRVLEILTEAFWNDPHIIWFTGNGPKKKKRIETMMSHSFESALLRGDVYMTSDKQAVAIWRNSKTKGFTIRQLLENIKFLFHFGFKKVKAIEALEKKLKAGYPKNEPFNYLFILGTSNKGRGKGLSSLLMNYILAESDTKGIPTYLETSNINNIPIYNKKGFFNYGTLDVDGTDPITVNLMVRTPSNLNKEKLT